MRLVRQLNFIEVLAMPLALMAPTAGMALNTPFAAATAGTAVPFVFILSTIGIACVGVGFIRLTRRFNDAGSVYGVTKAAVGPRYGFIAGWCLALVYVTFVGTLLAGFATFVNLLLDSLFHFTIPWALVVLAGGAAVWALGYRSIKLSTRVFLVCEGISIILMFALAAVIVFHGGSGGHSLSLTPLTPSGVGFGGLSAALVFGFLTFIGFEGSATLGEESENPSVAIPLTVLSAVILAGIVFICISYAQTVGFGLSAAGTKAYAASAAPNADLAVKFVGTGFAMALDLGAALSTFACALASADGAARVLFSLGRDTRLPQALARIHPRHSSPYVALGVSMVIGLAITVAFAPFTNSPSNVYGWTGALATLAVVIAYGMTSVGSVIYFWHRDISHRAYYNLIPVVVAAPLLGWTFYSQIIPVPPAPLVYWPYVMLGYLVIGFGILYAQRRRNVSRDAAWESESPAAAEPVGV
ncbi:MAG: APC family permease [Candidatus Dormiibacterota bacterium]